MKALFSLFTLLVFLFPLVEKGMHDFSHVNDTHCISLDKHFHSEEHHCQICDFTNESGGFPTFNPANLVLSETGILDFQFTINNLLLQEKHFHSLRAPPSFV